LDLGNGIPDEPQTIGAAAPAHDLLGATISTGEGLHFRGDVQIRATAPAFQGKKADGLGAHESRIR
jgi:hypothetical protein